MRTTSVSKINPLVPALKCVVQDGLLTFPQRLSSPREALLIDCTSELLRCAAPTPSPIRLICPGCCVPCASPFITFVELISVSLKKKYSLLQVLLYEKMISK